MNNFDIDTKELYALGMDITLLSKELNEELSNLFMNLSNINHNVWKGVSANEFARRANIEKIEFLKFSDSVYKYGKSLCDIAEKYDSAVMKVGDC